MFLWYSEKLMDKPFESLVNASSLVENCLFDCPNVSEVSHLCVFQADLPYTIFQMEKVDLQPGLAFLLKVVS